MLRIIKTRYAGPTRHRGARIIATDLKTGRRLIAPYDHVGLDRFAVVADRLANQLNAADGADVGPHVARHWYGSVVERSSKARYHVYEQLAAPSRE